MGDIPQELTIDHIDANPQNNSIENLQILTRENNTRKALKNKNRQKDLCINYTKTIFMLEHLIEKN